MLVSSVGLLTLFASLAQAHFIQPNAHMVRREELNECKNIHSTFTGSLDGWVLQKGSTEANYGFVSDALEMKILPPPEYAEKYSTLTNPDDKLPYNKYEGTGFTFNATTLMQYGKFSATVKSASVPGSVTAIILIADDGDEIDYEILAGGEDTITSNYFVSKKIVFGVNGRTIDPPNGGPAASEEYYKYTIDWSPERIIWSINDEVIRTLTKEDADDQRLPKSPSRVQIGLWDGSGASGTAQWARGPIDWEKQKEPVTAYIKDVSIECDPKYNQIV